MVRGPSHCRRAVRRFKVREEAEDGAEDFFFAAEKATGVNISRAGASISQSNVEAMKISCSGLMKCLIQFLEMGERASVIKRIRILRLYSLLRNVRRSIFKL